MTLRLVEKDIEAALAYWEAKVAGENFVFGDREIGASAYFTQRSNHSQMSAIIDGFADGMREARDISITKIRDTFKLIKGAV